MPRGVPKRYHYQCPKCGHVLTLGVPATEVVHRCHYNKNKMTTYVLTDDPKPIAAVQEYYEEGQGVPLVKDG